MAPSHEPPFQPEPETDTTTRKSQRKRKQASKANDESGKENQELTKKQKPSPTCKFTEQELLGVLSRAVFYAHIPTDQLMLIESEGLVTRDTLLSSLWTSQKFQCLVEKAQTAVLGIVYTLDSYAKCFSGEPVFKSTLWKFGANTHNRLPIPPFRFSVYFDNLASINTTKALVSGPVFYGGSVWRIKVEKQREGSSQLWLAL